MKGFNIGAIDVVSRETPLLRATSSLSEGFTYIKMQLPLIMETTIMWEECVEKGFFSFPGQKINLESSNDTYVRQNYTHKGHYKSQHSTEYN